MQPLESLAAQNAELLRTGAALIEALEDRVYTARCEGSRGGSVGGHFRHCLDFYGCLFRGLAEGKVDYDHRERDERIEVDRAYAARRMTELADGLALLVAEPEDRALEVKMDAAETASAPWGRSSAIRELQFLLSHTVHHYALIAMILTREGFTPPSDLGVAPSTLRYWTRS